MTTIYLFRHGQYETHDGILPYRLSGFHLTKKGRDDVSKVASTLVSKPIVAVYTSPMERTRETAEILAKPFDLVPVIDNRLNEVSSPTQGKTEEFLKSMGGWGVYDTDWYKENGGESVEEIAMRMRLAIEEFAKRHKGKEIVVVSHGDPLMILKAGYEGISLTPEALSHVPYIPMAGGYRLTIKDGQATIQSL